MRRVRREIPPSQGRLELEGAHELSARRLERLAGQRTPACFLECFCSGEAQLVGRSALELFVQRNGAVEMERADLEQLGPGAVV